MSLPLVETYEPPEIWASISNDIDDLVQNSKPLDQQVLPNLLDLSWSPKFNELLEEGVRLEFFVFAERSDIKKDTDRVGRHNET